MKFNIVLVGTQNKKDLVHLKVLLDVSQILQLGLEDLGHEVSLGSSLAKDTLNIILGYHHLWGKRLPADYECIIYQLEQFYENDECAPDLLSNFKAEYQRTLRSCRYIWDFSKANIEHLANCGIKATYKPIGFHPKMRRIRPDSKKDIDILFYGSTNLRRLKILNELAKKHTVKTLFGVYGQERDAYISRAKIVLGIHFYQARLFDEVRTTFLMNNRIFTVLEDTPHRKYDDVLVYAEYDRLVETCEYYLENENLASEKAAQAFRVFSRYPESEFLKSAIEKL
ncbi:MAG: hypothetical protein E2O79_05595 [Caldithrix sp.]|nr:MAG: hypothetical protein E2O79_05595 [Caldithrix sp.]